jgi:hypothetical protein
MAKLSTYMNRHGICFFNYGLGIRLRAPHSAIIFEGVEVNLMFDVS